MQVRGMAETLCARPPIPDVAKSLPCGRISAAGALPQSKRTRAIKSAAERSSLRTSNPPRDCLEVDVGVRSEETSRV